MPYRGYVRDRYGRRYDEEEDRYGREGVGSRDYDYDYDRERYDREERRGRERGEDRGFFDRAGDEVRSWFGDKE
ncbi:MAG TPA: SWFGD domain-containing protein, partial [Blastocatellia bacterium]|nr:SWFGD domain-containing protein [Blastocatellia bacterium]